MAAHLGIASLTPYGVTLATGAVAQQAEITESVEIVDTPGADSEYAHADPVNVKHIQIRVSGEGPADLTDVVSASIGTVTTKTPVSISDEHAPNSRVRFTIEGAAVDAFEDPATAADDQGAEPTIADLAIVTAEYSCLESVRRVTTVQDKVMICTDGTPSYRATCMKKTTGSLGWKGDLPTGLALGTGGANLSGMSTGKLIVPKLTLNERTGDWNGGNLDYSHYPAAA